MGAESVVVECCSSLLRLTAQRRLNSEAVPVNQQTQQPEQGEFVYGS